VTTQVRTALVSNSGDWSEDALAYTGNPQVGRWWQPPCYICTMLLYMSNFISPGPGTTENSLVSPLCLGITPTRALATRTLTTLVRLMVQHSMILSRCYSPGELTVGGVRRVIRVEELRVCSMLSSTVYDDQFIVDRRQQSLAL